MKKPKIKGNPPPAGAVRLTLNMPKALHERLATKAASSGVSMTAIIVAALKAKGVK